MNTDAVCKFVTICLPAERIYTGYSNGKQKTAYFTKLQLCWEDLYGCFVSEKHIVCQYLLQYSTQDSGILILKLFYAF